MVWGWMLQLKILIKEVNSSLLNQLHFTDILYLTLFIQVSQACILPDTAIQYGG